MRKIALLSAAALCLATSSAFALSDKPYITKEDIDIAALLPSPPTEASPAGQLTCVECFDVVDEAPVRVAEPGSLAPGGIV